LAAGQRLRRSNEFAAVIRDGRRAARGAVVVHLKFPANAAAPMSPSIEPAANPPIGLTPADVSTPPADHPARAGFVVSKAVGGAVQRNAVRRRLRHLVRDRLGTLPDGTDVVVRALPGSAGTPYRKLGSDLDSALAAAAVPRRRDRPRSTAENGGQR